MKKITNVIGELSGWLVFIIAVLLLIGFAGRTALHPVYGVTEFAQFALVAIIFLGLAICERVKAHPRVEVGILHLPKKLWQGANIFTYLVALVTVTLLLWGSAEEALFSIATNEQLAGVVRIPLFPAKITMTLGAALYLIQLMINTFSEIKQASPKPTEVEGVMMEAE